MAEYPKRKSTRDFFPDEMGHPVFAVETRDNPLNKLQFGRRAVGPRPRLPARRDAERRRRGLGHALPEAPGGHARAEPQPEGVNSLEVQLPRRVRPEIGLQRGHLQVSLAHGTSSCQNCCLVQGDPSGW